MKRLLKNKESEDRIDALNLHAIKLEPVVSLNANHHISHWEVLSASMAKSSQDWTAYYEAMKSECSQINQQQIRFVINVDSDQICQDAIWSCVHKITALPSCIGVEWTEYATDNNIDVIADRLLELKRKNNIDIHLDDVGSGDDPLVKTSLIRPDMIKIDGELFHRARTSETARNVIETHIECYKKLFIETIIEWIETPDDLTLALSLGADYGQGYYLHDLVNLKGGKHG